MLTKADDIIRFLDTGFYVMLWKNELGTYTAGLVNRNELNIADEDELFECEEHQITDADTPSKALYELSKKILSRTK